MLNTIEPGSSADEFAAAPLKFHRNASGRLLSGSVAVALKFTLWPTRIETAVVGVLITPLGAWLTPGTTTVTGAVAVVVRFAFSVTVTVQGRLSGELVCVVV